jgi:RimJ/RimL family protein N-acetyltransferase
MIRFLSIAIKQLRGLSFVDFLSVVKQSLFRDDPILIYALETSQVERRGNNASSAMDIRKGNILELEKNYCRFKSVPWEFQCHQYDGVKDFFIASNAEGVQHITWIYYQNDPNRFIRLGHGDAELKYALTLPLFRGQGLLPEVLKAVVRYLGQKGFKRAFTCVHIDNRPSIRGVEKAGFKFIDRIRLRKILGIQISKRYVLSEK